MDHFYNLVWLNLLGTRECFVLVTLAHFYADMWAFWCGHYLDTKITKSFEFVFKVILKSQEPYRRQK